MDPNRTLSLFFALVYLALAVFMLVRYPSSEASLGLVMLIIIIALALGMIWHGDEWAGPSPGVSMLGVSRDTPGCALVFLGWALLTLPAAIFAFALWLNYAK